MALFNANERMILANETAICRIALRQMATTGHINMCEIGRVIGVTFNGGQYAALREYFGGLELDEYLTPFRPRVKPTRAPQHVEYEPALV